MNAKRRNKNRATARWLKEQMPKPICPNCGVRGLHWIQPPYPWQGLWLCSNLPEGYEVKDSVQDSYMIGPKHEDQL